MELESIKLIWNIFGKVEIVGEMQAFHWMKRVNYAKLKFSQSGARIPLLTSLQKYP